MLEDSNQTPIYGVRLLAVGWITICERVTFVNRRKSNQPYEQQIGIAQRHVLCTREWTDEWELQYEYVYALKPKEKKRSNHSNTSTDTKHRTNERTNDQSKLWWICRLISLPPQPLTRARIAAKIKPSTASKENQIKGNQIYSAENFCSNNDDNDNDNDNGNNNSNSNKTAAKAKATPAIWMEMEIETEMTMAAKNKVVNNYKEAECELYSKFGWLVNTYGVYVTY